MGILVRSVDGAFAWVREAQRSGKPRYAVISIQDSHTGGFGVRFQADNNCAGVLTLLADDIVREIPGLRLFDGDMANAVIDFIAAHADVDVLLIHCYAGQSRSRAVGAFAALMTGGDNTAYFAEGAPNMLIYDMLEAQWTAARLREMCGDA